MSITEQDIKALKKTSSKSQQWALFILPLMVLFLLTMATLNLSLCHRFASMEGLDISEVFSKWVEGFSITDHYPGTLLMAIQRLETALIEIFLVILFGFLFWTRKSSFKRNARLLKFIEGRES